MKSILIETYSLMSLQFRKYFAPVWCSILLCAKGQLISKADWRPIDSPKKRTDNFVQSAFSTLHGKQIKFVHSFFGRIYGAQICLRFYLTFIHLKALGLTVFLLCIGQSVFSFWFTDFLPNFLLVVLFDHSMQKPDTKMGTKATQVKVAKQSLSKKTTTIYNKKKVGKFKHTRILLYWEREYKQAQLLLTTTSHFLISHLVGHLLEFLKISLAPPVLKIDNFS